MYNFQYGEYLANFYPDCGHIFEISNDSKCVLDLAVQRALRYLEMNCSALYGFPGEVIHTRDTNQMAVGMMPSLYESSLCLELLKHEAIDPSIVETLQRIILNGRRPSGYWNFFFNVKDTATNCFPDDIDDTVLSASCLYHLGKLSLDECKHVANGIMQSVMIGPNGGFGTWIQFDKSGNDIKVKMDKRLLVKPKEDIGSIINVLWFLAEIGMDTDDKALSSVECVSTFLDQHLLDINAVIKHFMIYYTDRYVIYFLIARYLEKSDYAKKVFGIKFAALLKNALLEMSVQDASVLQIACCILAAMKLGFDKENFEHLVPLGKQDVQKIRNKIDTLFKAILSHQLEDGSFPPWKLFRWGRRGYFGGSKTVTTTFAVHVIGMMRREMLENNGKYTTKDLEVY